MNKLINKIKSVADSAARLCQRAIKTLDEGAEIVADKICATVEGINWKRAAAVAVGIGSVVLSGVSAHAQSSSGFADPSTITTTATTVFTAVATLMVGIVGFWVVLKIVRKISGK